jgi:hypothetical protein
MASSGEGSFGHPFPRRRNTGGSFAPTTTTWKESAPTTMGFSPRTETNHSSEQCHAHHEGQLAQAHARCPPVELGPTPQLASLADRHTATAV